VIWHSSARKEELDLGAQVLKSLKAPVRMMVGEHDWFFDMGHRWNELFGPEELQLQTTKASHFVVLMSVHEKDFWTARGMTASRAYAHGRRTRQRGTKRVRSWRGGTHVAEEGPGEGCPTSTPIIVFSHSPLYSCTGRGISGRMTPRTCKAILQRFDHVTVLHGHTHQVLTNRIGNIQFHGMLSTAWPWPYAPQGLPALTVQMNRPNPFDPNDGLGDGSVKRASRRTGRQGVQPVEPQSNGSEGQLSQQSDGTQDRPVIPTLAQLLIRWRIR